MLLGRFMNPTDPAFAVAECVCARVRRTGEPVPPLVVEWQPGSDLIGDFTWAHGGIIVTERVGGALLERFGGFELRPVGMVQNPRLKRPKGSTRSDKPRVWLPYEGPPLCELLITAWVTADPDRSTIDVKPDWITGEPTCRPAGHEYTKYVPYPGRPGYCMRVRVPRVPGQGLFVAEQDLAGCGLFRVAQKPSWCVCAEPMWEFIVESGFTNIDFLETGETFWL